MPRDSFTSAEFYRYLEDGKLMGAQCSSCQKIHVPPRPICIECFSDDMRWVELSGKGRLQAFTIITVGPSFMVELGYDRKNPYCCGIVALEEGPQVSCQLLGFNSQKPESVKIGTPLALEIMKKEEGDGKRFWLGFNVEA